MKRPFASFIILSLVALLLTGCGGEPRPAGMPKLYPVSITVLQEGTPLAGATVTLVSETPELARWGPMGVTDANGVAIMRTNGRYEGAPLGTFKIVVSKMEREPHPNPEWANLPREDPNSQKYDAIELRLKAFNYIEPQYSSIADTPLVIEITAKLKTYMVDAGKQSKTEVKMNR